MQPSHSVLGQSVSEQHANLNNVRYATAFPGADACAKTQAAINDLPATGGRVIASFEGAQSCASGLTVGSTSYAGPSAPSLSQTSGGTLAATTYYVETTYVNAIGETLPSSESSLAVSANSLLVVPSPSATNNVQATGWNVYVSTTSGNETLQNSAPIAIGTSWTEPTSGITSTGLSVNGVQTGTVQKPVELVLGAMTLTVSQPIVIYAASSVTGVQEGVNDYYPTPTQILAAPNANLSAAVELGPGSADNGYEMLQDVVVDGNKAHNGAQVAILVNKAGRVRLSHLTARNAVSHGIEFLSTNNQSCCGKVEQVMSIGNGGDGLYFLNSSDTFVTTSEFEGNAANGLELNNSGDRIVQCDFGVNKGDGIKAENAAGALIYASQFNDTGDGIDLGTDTDNVIVGNEFIGTENPGVSDGIYANGSYNVIEGNSFLEASTSFQYRYSINLDTSSRSNTVVGNNIIGPNSAGAINNPAGAANTLRANWTGSTIPQGVDTSPTYFNNQPMQWVDTNGTAENVLDIDNSNTIRLGAGNSVALNAAATVSSYASAPFFQSVAGFSKSDNTGEHDIAFFTTNDSSNPFGLAIGLAPNGSSNPSAQIQASVFGISPNILALNPVGGNVGVGTASPGAALEVNGKGLLDSGVQIGSASGPTWTSGSAAPSGSCTTGSLYSNTGGSSGSTLYTCVSSAWVNVK